MKHNKVLAIALLCLCLAISFLPSPAFAQTDEYVTIARNFLLFRGSDKQIVATRLISANELAPDQPEAEIAFLAELSSGGYILVSTSRTISPVKAYSLTGNFDTLPPAYRRYLFREMEARVRNQVESGRYPLGLSETEKRWDFLLKFDPAFRSPLDYTPDTFLLTTRWRQNTPYNKFLPEIDGKNVLTGCVSVAMAQLMKYHNYPAAGQGIAAYAWNGAEMEAVFSRPYTWSNMPDAVGLAEAEYKIDEVALLIRDLAIMNRTDFGLEESSAGANLQGLAEHFGYSKDIMSMDNQTDVNLFFQTLRGEIYKFQPVLLELPGHMVVADGYGSDDTGKKIHLNMGWGGNYDDYYFLDQNIIAGNYIFSPNIQIHYNIKPCSAGSGDCVENLEEADQLDGTTITGNFDYAGDIDRYPVYLKGTTTIGGSRGYSTQSFYISLYDSGFHLLKSGDDPMTLSDLPAGLYTVRISLANESGEFYTFDTHTSYSVTITTDALTATEKAAADENLDSPPFIGNTFKDRLFNSSATGPSRILIDARDKNGDPISLSALASNPDAIAAAMEGNILVLTPAPEASHTASRIVITATANGKQTEKSFVAMVSDEDAGFGKSFTVSGIFENQEDSNAHRVILDGDCTITGYNGHSNQAFYSSVLNSAGAVISPPADNPINGSFSRGIYTLRSSLQENPGGSGGYYLYEAGVDDQYQLTISCPSAVEETETIAELLGIDLSHITPATSGDLDGNGLTDLADALLCLKALSRIPAGGLREDFLTSGADVAGDGRIGLQDAVYILQKTAGLR